MQCYERAGLPHRNYANMKSMDFTSLYTELEHSDIINAMINMLEYGRSIDNSMFNPQHNKATLHMLQIVLGTTYFKVPELDKFYHQKKGIPMGTNAAPNIANLTLCYYELEWTSHDQDALGKLRNNKLHLERYIDDIFTIHFHRVNEGRRGQLQKYIRNLKRYYPKSLILNDASTDSFLDIKFFFNPQNDESEPFRIETTTHQKELNLYQYTRKDSCAAPGVVKGLIHGELIRYAKRCSTFELWVGIRDRFKERLHTEDTPTNLLISKPPPVWRVVFKGTDNHIPYRKILNHVCEGITFVNDPSKVIICNIRMPTIIELLRAFQKKIEFFKYLNPDCTQQQIDTQFYKFIANKFLALKRGTHLNKITQRRVGGKDLLEDLKPPNTPANPPTPLILRLLTQTKPNHQPSNNPGSSQPPDDILGRITRLGTELTPPRKRVERPQASSNETPSSIPSNRKKKKKSSNEEKKRTLKQKCIDSFFTKSNSNNQNSDDSDDSGGGNSKKSTKLNQ
ncbi:hypothetical protein C9374_013747 [Naegleria lovaniensis]|uniref:Reverse transcriptase domain-containing protein n=1 Tax=Naegleria lovaniensis TaxID=51637 RepID=A0AA88GEK8_NAELO|nr:uncharacterized protein C9374_013747 [Naegleria lovaniensis]KAG2370912.1 hypothetical protein C9374_013747 [Naegleria lovaniensis]